MTSFIFTIRIFQATYVKKRVECAGDIAADKRFPVNGGPSLVKASRAHYNSVTLRNKDDIDLYSTSCIRLFPTKWDFEKPLESVITLELSFHEPLIISGSHIVLVQQSIADRTIMLPRNPVLSGGETRQLHPIESFYRLRCSVM